LILFARDAVFRQLGPQFVTTAFEAVGNVLEEQQAQDNVLVLGGIDLSTEGVCGLPQSVGVVQVAGHYVVVRHQNSLVRLKISVEAALQLLAANSCTSDDPQVAFVECWSMECPERDWLMDLYLGAVRKVADDGKGVSDIDSEEWRQRTLEARIKCDDALQALNSHRDEHEC
jgi:hypothetical protein